MSIVIIGGHDRMVCQYKKVCQKYQCKAKVFTQMSGSLSAASDVYKLQDEGEGSYVRSRKDSFDWYKQVIACDG